MPDDILHLAHPVPVRVVPSRGRHERTCLLSVMTSVRARRVPEGDMRPASHACDWLTLGDFHEDSAPRLHEAEGRVWVRVCRQEGATDGNRRRVPVTLEEFRACYAGPSARRPSWLADWTTLGDRCRGTPLVAWSPPERGSDVPYAKGASVCGAQTLPAGRVADDCTDEARSALRAFFERDVRLSGDGVYLSLEAPHHVAAQSFEGAYPSAERILKPTLFPRGAVLRRPASAPSAPLPRRHVERFLVGSADARGAGAFMARCAGFPPDGLVLAPHAHPRPGDVGLEGIVIHANEMPGRLLHLASRLAPYVPQVDLSPLRPLAARGAIGAISPEDASAVLSLCADLAANAWPRMGATPRSPEGMIGAYVAEIALPALAARDEAVPDADDAEAMLGMAP